MVAEAMPRRGDVFLVALSPTQGREIRKTRPSVIVSPDELNAHMGTFIIAPMTTGSHEYPFRVRCRFNGKDGYVVVDQVRTVDRGRLANKLGSLDAKTKSRVLGVLQEMFAP